MGVASTCVWSLLVVYGVVLFTMGGVEILFRYGRSYLYLLCLSYCSRLCSYVLYIRISCVHLLYVGVSVRGQLV